MIILETDGRQPLNPTFKYMIRFNNTLTNLQSKLLISFGKSRLSEIDLFFQVRYDLWKVYGPGLEYNMREFIKPGTSWIWETSNPFKPRIFIRNEDTILFLRLKYGEYLS